PNLCAEARLYRYPSEAERKLTGEKPVDEHNHALGALRYVASRVDARHMAQIRRTLAREGGLIEGEGMTEPEAPARLRSAARAVQGIPGEMGNGEDIWTDFSS